MRVLRRFFTRLFNFTTRRDTEERIREEILSHLSAVTAENIRGGMNPEEALRHTRLQFGPVDAVREDCRAEQGLPWLEELLGDIRYALRVLRKSPSFTAAALVTLTLGIGVNVVVFGVLNAVMLKPLAVSTSETLYQVRKQPKMSGGLLTTSYPAFEDFRQRNTSFSGMTAINGYSEAILRWRTTVIKIRGYEVAGNYFDLLGVQPELGRFFHPTDERGPGSAPYVILSQTLWRTVFNANPDIVGTTVDLNEYPFTVLGVAPARFHGTERFERPDYWIPMINHAQVAGWDYLRSRASIAVTMIGRLRPGISPQQATDDLNRISAQLAKEHPQTDQAVSMRLIRPGLFGDDGEVIAGFLYGVTSLALLVLAGACANLASLFAARAADRTRELALRVALGSSRARLVRQLLTEAGVVSLLGGTTGLVTAKLALGMLNRWNPSFGYGGQRLAMSAEMDSRVYLAGLALTLGSALLFGLLPALRASQSSPLQMIKGAPMVSLNLRRFTLGDLLLGTQIAISTLLITASLVAMHGLVQALQAPLGIEPQGVMLAEMDLRHTGQDGEAALERQKAMIHAVENIPGVTAVGVVRNTPMAGGKRLTPVYRQGTTEFLPINSALGTRVYPMSPGYLKAAGTRLLSGRDVTWHDTLTTPYVAIVNETFARTMWGETTAIGQRFFLADHLIEVVGVAEDGKYHDLMESPQAAVYLPLAQKMSSETVLVVRSQLSPNEIAAALQRVLSSLEPSVLITLQNWRDALGHVLLPARAASIMLGFIGLMGVLLTVTGIFGMAAYSVSNRKKELGIRRALGARSGEIMRAAVGRPVELLGLGATTGLVVGCSASGLLGRIVYQAETNNPVVLIGVTLTMVLAGSAGFALPTWRALRIDPSELMREQ